MKKYKIKYAEGDTINKVTTINAEDSIKAMMLFYLQFTNCEILEIKEAQE